MGLSSELKRLLEVLLYSVEEEPLHTLTPKNRYLIYTLFEVQTNPIGRKALGWLAVKTAKSVLPIFEETFPPAFFQQLSSEEIQAVGYLSPQKLIEAAEEILKETVPLEIGKNLIKDASTSDWKYAKPDVPNGADLASRAARRALSEACGHIPFQNLGMHNKTDNVSIQFLEDLASHFENYNLAEISKKFQSYFANLKWTNGLEWEDKDLSIVAGDSASSAVMAYSCGLDFSNPFNPVCNILKTLEFWQWWLTEAIPQAWELAEQFYQPKSQ